MAEIICLAQIGLLKTVVQINTLECFLPFMLKVGGFPLEKKKKFRSVNIMTDLKVSVKN